MKRAIVATLAIMLAWSSAARADDADAMAAMRRGVAAFGRGDAEEALREYETAKQAAPLANAPYRYAAEALLALGRFPQAVENLEAYLAKKADVSDADEVKEQIARIRAEHFPARARIASNVEAAEVVLDGESKGVVATFETTPGKHFVELRAAGYENASRVVALIGDQETAVPFTLAAIRAAERILPLDPVVPVAPREPTIWRSVGWVTGGVGAATLITTIVLDAGVLGPKVSDYRTAADRGDPSARGLRDDARSLQTITLAGYVVSGVLLATGTALVLFAPDTAGHAARVMSRFGTF